MVDRDFLRQEDGAVTVDWVVMTAALVGLAIAIAISVSSGLDDLSGNIATELEGDLIVTSFGYNPNFPDEHALALEGLRNASPEDRALFAEYVNSLDAQNPTDPDDVALLADLNDALDTALVENGETRPTGADPDPQDLDGAFQRMGFPTADPVAAG